MRRIRTPMRCSAQLSDDVVHDHVHVLGHNAAACACCHVSCIQKIDLPWLFGGSAITPGVVSRGQTIPDETHAWQSLHCKLV